MVERRQLVVVVVEHKLVVVERRQLVVVVVEHRLVVVVVGMEQVV